MKATHLLDHFGAAAAGAVYDELKDGQKETSGPIEGWKWPGDSPEDADIKGLIALTLIRERPCENEIWADNLFVLIEKEGHSRKATPNLSPLKHL